MKVAVVIAKFPSGWRALCVGEDIGAIKSAFKTVRGEGVLVHKEEIAEVAMLFDSAGNIRRKFLRTPEARDALEAGKDAFASAAAAKEQKLAADAAAADGTAAARKIAEKAVALVTSEIAGGGSEEIAEDVVRALASENEALRAELAALKSKAESVSPGAQAPAAEPAGSLSNPPAAPGTQSPAEPGEDGDAAARFGGDRPGKPSRKR